MTDLKTLFGLKGDFFERHKTGSGKMTTFKMSFDLNEDFFKEAIAEAVKNHFGGRTDLQVTQVWFVNIGAGELVFTFKKKESQHEQPDDHQIQVGQQGAELSDQL